MTLKRKISKLEDVAEGVQEFYTLQEDGSYLLDAESEDLPGVKVALERERENVLKAKKEAARLREQYKGIDLDEYQRILDDAEQLKKKKLLDSGQVDEVIAQRMAKAQKESQEREDALTARNSTLAKQLQKELIDNRLNDLATKNGVRPEALRDVRLRGQQTWRINEQGEPVALDGDKVLYGKDPTQPLTMQEWFTDEKKDSPQWFGESSGANSPPGNTQTRGNGQFVLTQEEAKNPQRYRMVKEQAEKAGQAVQIAE